MAMRCTYVLRTDSYRSARASFSSLFANGQGNLPLEVLEKRIRNYAFRTSRHLSNRPLHERKSWIKGNISLILRECRQRVCFPVAFATLQIVVSEIENNSKGFLAENELETTWMKDAFASCRSPDELRQIEALLNREELTHNALQNAPLSAEGSMVSSTMDSENVGFLTDRSNAVHVSNISDAQLNQASKQWIADPMVKMMNRQRGQVAIFSPNSSFSRYFQKQGIVSSEEEVTKLFEAIRSRPKRIGFRIHRSHMYGEAAEAILKNRSNIEPVTWVPPSYQAYTFEVGPDTKMQGENLETQKLLGALAKERIISFQNLSSLLPVALLDPKPGQAILDMCASPGGKSALILDVLANQTPHQHLSSAVVAADGVPNRLTSLSQRLENYSSNVATLAMDGRSQRDNMLLQAGVPLFDSVLVDAPCSGEARLGREASSWRLWHPIRALHFHSTQISLLHGALSRCRVGGTVVYATCTLNPLENEAILSAILSTYGDSVELVPPPSSFSYRLIGKWNRTHNYNVPQEKIPALSKGLASWFVPSRSGSFYRTWEEVTPSEKNISSNSRGIAPLYPPSLFSPLPAIGEALERYCYRCLPHMNDGFEGFFIAKLRKVKSFSLSPSQGALDTTNPINSSSIGARTFSFQNPLSRSTSLLRKRNLVQLSLMSLTLQHYLLPFFSHANEGGPSQKPISPHASTSLMESALQSSGLIPLWSEEEGLRLVSGRLAEILRDFPIPSLPIESHEKHSIQEPALHTAGVLVISKSDGFLTEAGALLLREIAVSRILSLELAHIQSLLANYTLTFSEDSVDISKEVAIELLSNRVVHSQNSEKGRLFQHIYQSVSGQAGNAILVVQKNEADRLDYAKHNTEDIEKEENKLTRMTLPIFVEFEGDAHSSGRKARVSLLLSKEARSRSQAMIGRLTRVVKTSINNKNYVRESANYDIGKTMNPTLLYGEPQSSSIAYSKQNRRLFEHEGEVQTIKKRGHIVEL